MAFSYFYWLSGIWHSIINVRTPRTAQTPKIQAIFRRFIFVVCLEWYTTYYWICLVYCNIIIWRHVFSAKFVELVKYFSKCSKSVCSPSFLSRVSIIERYDGLAFMKTKPLKLILTENVGWPTSTLKGRLNFRKFCPSNPLAYEIPKKERISSFVTSQRHVYLSLLHTSSGSCLINAIIFLLVLFKTVVIISSVKKFVHMSMGSFLLRTLLWSRA